MHYGTQYNEHITAEMRISYATAAIIGGLRRGEIVRTPQERIEILSCRYKAHKEAGRMQAALACKRNAQRIFDSMKGNVS
jgi:hypothetical protein